MIIFRSCYTYVCDYADFCTVSSASAVSTFINPAQVIHEVPLSRARAHTHTHTHLCIYTHFAIQVVTVKTANLRSGRFLSDEASWFPGYTWSPATCRTCESHLGARTSDISCECSHVSDTFRKVGHILIVQTGNFVRFSGCESPI